MNGKMERTAKKALLYTTVILVTVIVMYPIAWMVSYSLRTNTAIFDVPPSIIPEKVVFEHYSSLWRDVPFAIFFRNSLVVSLTTTLLVTMIASMAAYSISRFRFVGKRIFSFLLLCSQLFPVAILLVPLFLLFNAVNLYDNLSVLIISYTGITLAFSILLLVGFFNEIPRELDEAAYVDGASKFKVFTQIVLPVAAPGLVTVAIYVFITSWQEFLLALSLTFSENNRTLPVGLMYFFGQYRTNYAGLMAISNLASFPAIALFLILQRFFVKGLIRGAIKG